MDETNWETDEVINWLSNDEGAYSETYRMTADEIKRWVEEDNAPSGLYESFDALPKSSFDDVDWDAVEESLQSE